LLAISSWIIFWLYNRFVLPRNKKGKVGIVIAIFSENEKERKMLKADFVSKLKNDFQQEGILNSEIIFLKNHFSGQIKESGNPRKKLDKINEKIKAHLYIWGDIKKRPDGDEGEKYFLTIQYYVVHKPITQDFSNKLANDFSKAFLSQIEFLENKSFKELKASAAKINLAIKYIVGIAAFVSQDPKLALKLHSRLKINLDTLKPLPTELIDIKGLLQITK